MSFFCLIHQKLNAYNNEIGVDIGGGQEAR